MTVKSIAPFRVDPIPFTDGDGFKRIIVEDAQANIVAEILPMADQVTNAAMFAACPVMLAALVATEALLSNDPNHRHDGWMSDTLREVRAAIAAANPVSYLRSIDPESVQ